MLAIRSVGSFDALRSLSFERWAKLVCRGFRQGLAAEDVSLAKR